MGRNHLIYFTLKGLRKAKVKVRNYSLLAALHEGDLYPQ
jgi:hypothetical protein